MTDSLAPDSPTVSVDAVKAALCEWVGTLSNDEKNKVAIIGNGRSYSPLDIQDEVQRGTPFGERLIKSLIIVHNL